MGNNYQLHMGKCNGPDQVVQKNGHECTISERNQVGRHGLYSRHYSRVFAAPKNARNTETKHQSGAVPILLLVLLASTTSAYSSLSVLQGLNPQRWLLKVSVYHSATSAVFSSLSSQHWENCMNAVIILDNQHWLKEDPEYGQILKRMLSGDLTKEDHKRINTRVIGYNGLELLAELEGEEKINIFKN